MCPESNVVGLLTSFAAVFGTVVATIILKHLQGVASDLKDERQHNSEIASPAGDLPKRCSEVSL